MTMIETVPFQEVARPPRLTDPVPISQTLNSTLTNDRIGAMILFMTNVDPHRRVKRPPSTLLLSATQRFLRVLITTTAGGTPTRTMHPTTLLRTKLRMHRAAGVLVV